MVVIVVAVLIALSRVAMARGWPGTTSVRQWWRRTRPSAIAYVRGSPATFLYLFVLSITTWVLLGLTPDVVDAILQEHSTNLDQLRTDPVRVLIRSAFWVDGYFLLVWVVLFAVVLAPAERWLGTIRWVVVFVAGHVGATLATAAGLWLAIRWGLAPASLEGVVDIGVSYGFAALAAVFTYRLPTPARWWWAGGLVVIAMSVAAISRTFTDFGHLAALLIGFAMYPITRSPAVEQRSHGPIWRPAPVQTR